MHVRIPIHIEAYMTYNPYTHTHMQAYVCIHTNTYAHVHTCIQTYIHTYMHACMHTYITCTHTYLPKDVYIHTYDTSIRSHIHTYILTLLTYEFKHMHK